MRTWNATYGDLDTSSGSAKGIRVRLIDDNTVLLDTGRGIARVSDASHGRAGGGRLGFNAQRLVVVDNLVVQDLDARDGHVRVDGPLE